MTHTNEENELGFLFYFTISFEEIILHFMKDLNRGYLHLFCSNSYKLLIFFLRNLKNIKNNI